jgi:superfamily I DNA/RNA helicase
VTNDSDHLSGLNNEQREAALHIDGPLLIVAGAGEQTQYLLLQQNM